METELAKSIAVDEHLAKTPEEDKYGRYGLDKDYAANGRIMVTITLAEYRELLTGLAAGQVSEANSKRYTVERERDELKKQVEELRKQLNDLRGMIASAVPLKAAADSQDE